MGYIIALIAIMFVMVLFFKFWFIALPIAAILIIAFIVLRRQNKNKQMNWTEIEKYKKPIQSNEPILPKQEDVEPQLDRNNCQVIYPDELNGLKRTYEVYKRVRLIPCVRSYDRLSFVKPLKFVYDGEKTLVYQGPVMIGYVDSERVQKVIRDFAAKNCFVVGYLKYIDPERERLKASVAYYEKSDMQNSIDESEVWNELRKKVKLKIELKNGDEILAPAVFNAQELYNAHINYNVCVITTEEPDYSKLKLGEKIEFIQEPDNIHDSKAVKIMQDGIKIGYLYRGETQDEVNSFISFGNTVTGYLTGITPEDQYSKLQATILLYK